MQLFWICLAVFESDFEHEFLLALRLLDKVLNKLPLDRPGLQNLFLVQKVPFPHCFFHDTFLIHVMIPIRCQNFSLHWQNSLIRTHIVKVHYEGFTYLQYLTIFLPDKYVVRVFFFCANDTKILYSHV